MGNDRGFVWRHGPVVGVGIPTGLVHGPWRRDGIPTLSNAGVASGWNPDPCIDKLSAHLLSPGRTFCRASDPPLVLATELHHDLRRLHE